MVRSPPPRKSLRFCREGDLQLAVRACWSPAVPVPQSQERVFRLIEPHESAKPRRAVFFQNPRLYHFPKDTEMLPQSFRIPLCWYMSNEKIRVITCPSWSGKCNFQFFCLEFAFRQTSQLHALLPIRDGISQNHILLSCHRNFSLFALSRWLLQLEKVRPVHLLASQEEGS